ncbi:hypothetical protein AB0395_06470 [Streptosporangium sp. NPDC051023]|uniref:hypothetical protein n=1 Tax=Streptosporangium sp. NPDC051023 TaxID=3155410 RepID=UPI00344F88C3
MSEHASAKSICRTVAVLLAALVTCFALAPSANAQGNCTHYGVAGYAQLFTGYNFDGDCYEVRLNTGSHVIPAYASRKISSLRSWGWYGGERVWLADSYYNGGADFPAGQWVTYLGPMDDKADSVEFR